MLPLPAWPDAATGHGLPWPGQLRVFPRMSIPAVLYAQPEEISSTFAQNITGGREVPTLYGKGGPESTVPKIGWIRSVRTTEDTKTSGRW